MNGTLRNISPHYTNPQLCEYGVPWVDNCCGPSGVLGFYPMSKFPYGLTSNDVAAR
jgi:hypothetical protein